jgi:hypothetical protein
VAVAAEGCCRCCRCEAGGGAATATTTLSAAAASTALPLLPPPPPPPLPGGLPKLTIEEDPLDLSPRMATDYRAWATVLARVLLAKAGGDGEAAAAALGRLMLTTHGLVAKAADGDGAGGGGEPFGPLRLHLSDPVFGRDAAAARPGFGGWLDALAGGSKAARKVEALAGAAAGTRTLVTGKAATSIFFDFSPCVLSETHVGASGELTALNFEPRLIDISPAGFSAWSSFVLGGGAGAAA